MVALGRTGELAVGGTAVVTLEPWQPRGHDPPCLDARVDSFSTVVYPVADPNLIAAGGATHLAAAGVADLFGPPDSFRSYGIRASRLTDRAT